MLGMVVAGLCGLITAMACGAFDGEDSPPVGPADASNPPDGSTGADGPVAAGDGGVDPRPDAGQDAGRGVLVNNLFLVSATEVTNAEYDAFLVALLQGDAGTMTGGCDFKKGHTRLAGCAATMQPNAPVNCVDWCDAYRYCGFNGMRLCGKIGGGPTNLAEIANPLHSQWTMACGGAGPTTYPYGGPDASAGACNIMELEAGAPAPVRSFPRCEGSPKGLFDMSGNVDEWEDACDDKGKADDDCRVRGGSFLSTAAAAKCTSAVAHQRKQAFHNVGFRCCADP